MPLLREVVDLLHEWYPPTTAEDWDAVGLVSGHPDDDVRKVMFAVDATGPVADEAASWGADLLVVHHPLFLKGVHSVAAVTPKGSTLHTLSRAGCALLTAHTNADRAPGGVSESLALALGLRDLRPLVPDAQDGETGTGRRGVVPETTLAGFASAVVERLPTTAHGVRVAGDPERVVRRVAVCGGAGDFLLDELATSDVDVYVTSDLRHHPVSEFVERHGPALIDISHWAAEWTWLPVVRARLQAQWGDTVDTRVSTLVTDPWTMRLDATPPY
jgi:dinuclear metal center YbgI/SA1388 family protein